ncbi:partition protein [Bacillus phage Shbh1]|uniref:Plasmid segregation protein-like protein n=1 Tax=Bacillus phage Shbh1 TaxID=1796992 RepID=A0A142F143_9CAUD|nr:partition protein [Bacillus phage Shbh1]AMQ66500.1 plasmid segregation protein-like protein [Bacillus phage Shbh1]
MSNENYNVKALDDGYGDVKYDSRGVPSLIPSFVTAFKPKPKEVFSNSKQKKSSYVASEVDGLKYVVGDYAAKLDPNIRWVGGENKHNDSRFPILLKTTLGLMSTGPQEVIDTLMMNLPIKYDTSERRRVLEEVARGTHKVGISTDGVNFVNKIITVEDVDVKKQPFGSLCDVILDGSGDIVEVDIAKGFNVVVDIGARTLNVLTIDALEEQPEPLTTQTNDGMFSAYSQIGAFLEQELGVLIPDGKLPQIIKDREIKNRDITPLIDQVYATHANTILTILDKILVNSWGFVTSIVFTGGGADKDLLRPYLENAFKGVNTLFLDRYANARGLRKYGIRQAKKNIKRTRISVKVGSTNYEYEA